MFALQVRALGDITTRLGDRSPGRTEWASGFSDMVLLPFNLGWTNGDFKYGMAPMIFAPTGEYNQDQLANVGLGYWTFTPMLYGQLAEQQDRHRIQRLHRHGLQHQE